MLNMIGHVSTTTRAVASDHCRRIARTRQTTTATTVLAAGEPVPATEGSGSQISTTPNTARPTANAASMTSVRVRRGRGSLMVVSLLTVREAGIGRRLTRES